MTYTFDATIISDLYKDAYGFRPSMYWLKNFRDASNKRKQQIWDNLCRDVDSEIEREKQEQADAIKAFEQRVTTNLLLGAADRETAIRWVIESLEPDNVDLRYGGAKICFDLGLPYSMAGVFEPICKALLEKMNDD